ncbi:hypothetical protein HU200_036736 [Digitaria exilis]|uniref:Receptor kinase-like protein Xa21 n=1 Tax=Digitaria exilis TaxID=1010633 RepID=A0A835BM31_9POAL|nr:hypothetical protein HU200_036736 [Digitaria exilis]
MYNISSMREFQLQGNLLHGSFPADIGSKFPDILTLSFDRNQFTGSIPSSLSNGWEFITSMSNCSQLQVLDISINPGFTGPLPSAIMNLSWTLQILQLEYTGISSSIPDAISNLVNLEILHVGDTSISGVLPESIGKLGNLAGLYLYNTNLSGLIPATIGNLSKLSDLHAYNCNFVGAIPSTLGKLNSLEAIDLSINRLSGSIPREIFNLPALSIFFSLSQNLLSGPLPSEVGNLVNLNSLSLYGNQLSGEIPDTIGKCTVLEGLWLYNNSFEGTIPDSLNNIIGLRVLNLSINKLAGYIPDSVGGIRDLQRLGLAHNHLSGPIPTNLQNLTSLIVLDLSFNNLQVTGNDNLCGGIPQLHLHPCHASSVENNRNWRSKCVTIALSTAGTILFLLLISICIKVMYKKVRKNNDRPYLPSVVEEQYERVSYQALANGTNKFSEANLVGKGSFGAVYKCTFHDEGTIVAVKVFNLEKSGSSKSFVAECEALRRVRHRCLLKIITCCSSINHLGQEFKALVFEYMPNGSLSGWLHQESATPTVSNTLSLEQRLDIAIDIMDALDYLHNRCQPQIIHCDVKPSNILIAEDMSARVGDFGISRMLVETTHNALSSSISTVGIRGSIGYVAPEYGEGSSVSSAGDVYSLGILLLEMFTGRSPTNDMFRGSWDLHKFCEDALPRRILDIVDTTLWLHTVIRDNTMRSTIENCLLSVISLGISCSQKQPKERTPIQDAAIEMHAIRDLYLKSAASVVQEHSEIATESADL